MIKSFTEENIQRSIKFGVWCSTEAGNKRLNDAFHSVTRARPDASTGEDAAPGHVYLFFSVNMSGFFSGIAEMVGAVNASIDPGDIWEQTRSGARWRGLFPVRWLYVRDVPNDALNHITVATNDGKPVTHSRDTTEVPRAQGEQVFEIIARHEKVTTSLFDDYIYYERCRLHRHLGIVFADDWRKEHDL